MFFYFWNACSYWKCIIIGYDANAVDNYVVFDSIRCIFWVSLGTHFSQNNWQFAMRECLIWWKGEKKVRNYSNNQKVIFMEQSTHQHYVGIFRHLSGFLYAKSVWNVDFKIYMFLSDWTQQHRLEQTRSMLTVHLLWECKLMPRGNT